MANFVVARADGSSLLLPLGGAERLDWIDLPYFDSLNIWAILEAGI